MHLDLYPTLNTDCLNSAASELNLHANKVNKGPKVDEDVNSIPKSFPCTTPGLPRQQVGPDVVTSDFTSGNGWRGKTSEQGKAS